MESRLAIVRQRAQRIITFLNDATRKLPEPLSAEIVRLYGRDPYLILISCLLSLRARDTVTFSVCQKLFSYAKTSQEMVKMPGHMLEEILHPIGFYTRKAATLQEVSQELLDRFHGKVPSTAQELLSLKGVGIKTANLVLGEAYHVPALCVDTHVHRLANHWGLVKTATPEETERALARIIPKNDWIRFNYLLVKWGQNVCKRGRKPGPCKYCVQLLDYAQR